MNLGVSEQAQRKKREKKRSRKKNKDNNQPTAPSSSFGGRRKLFQTKTMKVEQRKIGLIIGQNGKNIKALYEITHCDIITPTPRKKTDDDDEYEIFMDGNFYYEYDAYDKTEKYNNKPIHYVYDNDDKKESKNKKNDKNNNKDDNEEEEDLNDPKRLLEIKLRGTPEEIRDAEVEIKFMIKNGRLMLDSERDGSDSNKKKSILYASRKTYDDANDFDEIAHDMRVPSKICGMLIGGGGQKIKEISKKTGCDVWVDWDKESHIEAGVSTVHLKGTKFSVENAKREIRRVQRLFEKGSNNYRFEIPSYCARSLFGEKGGNLKKLQKQYGVTINVKNFKYEHRKIRIGNETQRVQHTMMISLIGEKEDVEACKLAIDRLVGDFVKCEECKNLTKYDDGHPDEYSGRWYCDDCWDEFNGIKKKDDDDDNKNMSNRFGNLDIKNKNQPQRQPQQQPQQQPYQQQRQPRQQGGYYNYDNQQQGGYRQQKW